MRWIGDACRRSQGSIRREARHMQACPRAAYRTEPRRPRRVRTPHRVAGPGHDESGLAQCLEVCVDYRCAEVHGRADRAHGVACVWVRCEHAHDTEAIWIREHPHLRGARLGGRAVERCRPIGRGGHRSAQEVVDLPDAIWRDGVPHEPASLLSDDEPVVGHEMEMMADRRLAQAETFREFAAGRRTVGRPTDDAEQLEPCGVRHRAKRSCERLGRRPVQGSALRLACRVVLVACCCSHAPESSRAFRTAGASRMRPS